MSRSCSPAGFLSLLFSTVFDKLNISLLIKMAVNCYDFLESSNASCRKWLRFSTWTTYSEPVWTFSCSIALMRSSVFISRHFPSQFHFRRIKIRFRAANACPTQAAGLPHTLPASGFQACPRFALQNVCDEALVSHRPGNSPCGSVEHGARIARAVRAQPIDLQCPVIVKVARHRSAYNSNTDDFLPIRTSNRKLMSDRRLVMTVMISYIGVCTSQRYRYDFKRHG